MMVIKYGQDPCKECDMEALTSMAFKVVRQASKAMFACLSYVKSKAKAVFIEFAVNITFRTKPIFFDFRAALFL